MSKKRIFLWILICLLLNLSSCFLLKNEQQPGFQNENFNVIAGKITDKSGNGAPGVTVTLDHASSGTLTDKDGNFLLYGTNKDTLHFSYPGYTSSLLSLQKSPLSTKIGDLKINFAYKNIVNTSSKTSAEVPINAFPFPPLVGYTQDVLDNKIFRNCKTLDQIDKILSAAISACGYDEKSYFKIPGGFALVTRIETMNSNGTSIYNSQRFAINEQKSMDFSSFFSNKAGNFRMFIFIVTDMSFKSQTTQQNFNNLLNMCRIGYNVLPIHKVINDKYHCTVIVYEFEADQPNVKLIIRDPLLSAKDHLEKSKIASYLNNK